MQPRRNAKVKTVRYPERPDPEMSSKGRSATPPDRADSSLFVPPSTSLIHPNDAAKAQMASRGIDGLRHARRRTVAAAIVRKGKGDTLLFASVSGTSSRSHVLLRCRVPSLCAEPIRYTIRRSSINAVSKGFQLTICLWLVHPPNPILRLCHGPWTNDIVVLAVLSAPEA